MREFVRFSRGGPGHTCEFVVQAEVVLVGNLGTGFAFLDDFNTFLRLDGLMESFAEPSTDLFSSSEFINEKDFTVFDEVINIAFVEIVRSECLIDVMHHSDVSVFIEVPYAETAFDFFNTFIGKGYTATRFPFLVDLEVFTFSELCDDAVNLPVEFRGFTGGF